MTSIEITAAPRSVWVEGVCVRRENFLKSEAESMLRYVVGVKERREGVTGHVRFSGRTRDGSEYRYEIAYLRRLRYAGSGPKKRETVGTEWFTQHASHEDIAMQWLHEAGRLPTSVDTEAPEGEALMSALWRMIPDDAD